MDLMASVRETADVWNLRKALIATNTIPVLPLVEIIVSYARGHQSIVTTIPVRPAVRFTYPFDGLAVDSLTGELIVSEMGLNCFKAVDLSTGETRVIAGQPSADGFRCGPALQAVFRFPASACVDPRNPNRLYLLDANSVRVLERTGSGDGVVTLIAGGAGTDAGLSDGVGPNARFQFPRDIKCTRDGATLLVCDTANQRLRSIDVANRLVTTVAGDGDPRNRAGHGTSASLYSPRHASFDPTTVTPDSILYIACAKAIMRFNRRTNDVQPVTLRPSTLRLDPCGIVGLPSGVLLITCRHTDSLYTVDPTTGAVELLAGSGVPDRHGKVDGLGLGGSRFNSPYGLCVTEAEECAIVADCSNYVLRRVTLSPDLFIPRPTPDEPVLSVAERVVATYELARSMINPSPASKDIISPVQFVIVYLVVAILVGQLIARYRQK